MPWPRWLPLASAFHQIKAVFLPQKSLPKGDYPMLKVTAYYTRFILSALATVAFIIDPNT
jgi:hypothetical protein